MGITNTFDNDSDEIICPQDAIAATMVSQKLLFRFFLKNLVIYCLIQLK